MMPYSRPVLAVLRCSGALAAALVLAACAASTAVVKPDHSGTTAKAVSTAPRGESELLLAAENALREGNCRSAAENFLAAARVSSQTGVASRAAQIGVGCNQLTTAREAVARWRTLEPYSGDAALTAALIALKRYDLPEARVALTAWRDSGSAGSQDPLRFAQLLEEETEATATYRVFGDVLLGADPTADVLLAQARLAMAAQNMNAAKDAATRALALNEDLTEARTIQLRAQSVLGEHEAAITGARALGAAQSGEDAFLLADLLIAADHRDDAEQELLRLVAIPDSKLGAERRLIGLAIRDGNLDSAEKRIEPLMGERGSTAIAILYAAQLAERRGDDARAIQSYRLLSDSSVALAARSAAARLMLKRGDRKSALALLEDYAAQNPEQAIEIGATRAQLLAQAGDVKAGLEVIDQLGEAYPDHPDIDYQRATILETGGRTREALLAFERALRLRPDDPQLANALGFTLADHRQRLAQAERLVRQAIAVSPDNPAIQDSLGWVLYRRGKTRDAIPALERAWVNSEDGEIAAHYGEVLWAGGDQGKARYIWQQALSNSPGHKAVQATMARLTGEDGTHR
jgi:tetratricopeptide (TPR) repeat protein